MAGQVLTIDDIITPDNLGDHIAKKWITWDMLREERKRQWEEVRRYIFATDTTQTSNSKLPWKNKTTIPKLCQIRDNIYANYSQVMFPQRKSSIWEAAEENSDSADKRDAIVNYMAWVKKNPSYKHEMDKCILDFIDCGDAFGMPEWVDQRVELEDKVQAGYVGPVIRRINPLDIVFNPTAANFEDSPKIIRSLVSLGEVKQMLERMAETEQTEAYRDLWRYLTDVRTGVKSFPGDIDEKDSQYNVQGFSSFRSYLESDYVEILTFYGDLYNSEEDELLKNHVIMVVDRHKVISKKPNPSFFGYPPIFHVSWRKRQDNLWGMGPLDNLVGMQYRIDHLENLKADVFDLVAFPPLKIRGLTEDFEWGPFSRIYVGDDGDVEVLSPDVQALQANFEIQNLERLMEEMAGAPREAAGFRTPGEKTKYEVQRLENAASRIFQNKIRQFEEHFVEPLDNAMLELARRNMSGTTVIEVFDNELKASAFRELNVQDITGVGRIKPVAARHFAEQAEAVQNLTNLFNSPLGQMVAPHYSSVQLAKFFEQMFKLEDYGLVLPYIALAEQADAQRQSNALLEQVLMESQTPSGLTPDDFDQGLELPPELQGPLQ